METLHFEFVATEPPVKKALVGCVGSGDLEILMEPGEIGKASIQVVTSVDGSAARWHNLFERIFTAQIPPAVNIDIHDFGATPVSFAYVWNKHWRRLLMTDIQSLLSKQDFIELSARERAKALLDEGTFRELLDPFARVMSPWLVQQNIVPQADDGVVVGKGTIQEQPIVLISIEGLFQGGSLGEVGGAKIAGALELAVEDNLKGIPTAAILLLETGGVRLQEANLGLAAIAEIQAAIVNLRQYQPVIAVVAGSVGCFGGMSIAAGLCSYIVMTQEGRLGLNGPQVIEQEAGVQEYNAKDRPFIWSITGGNQRFASGLADAYVDDDRQKIRQRVIDYLTQGVPHQHRSSNYPFYLEKLQQVDTAEQITPAQVQALYQGEQA